MKTFVVSAGLLMVTLILKRSLALIVLWCLKFVSVKINNIVLLLRMAATLETCDRLNQTSTNQYKNKLTKLFSYLGTKALFILLCVYVVACSDTQPQKQVCSEAWFEKVDRQITSGDGQGHGPDLGSLEWRSVVEFKLGVRGDESLPAADSERWCTYIDQHFIN